MKNIVLPVVVALMAATFTAAPVSAEEIAVPEGGVTLTLPGASTAVAKGSLAAAGRAALAVTVTILTPNGPIIISGDKCTVDKDGKVTCV